MAFNPDLHTVSNKPYATALAEPVDARTYYYDEDLFSYRPFQSTAEVIAYLNTPESRTGQFSIIINETDTLLPNGTFSDTTIGEWWFKDGVADENLVPKTWSWQQTLDVSSVLDKDNTIDGGDFDFVFDSTGDVEVTTPSIILTSFPNTTGQVLSTDENGNVLLVDVSYNADLMRFGIEDNLGIQNRAVDMDSFDLEITNAGDIFIESGSGSSLSILGNGTMILAAPNGTYLDPSLSGGTTAIQFLTTDDDGKVVLAELPADEDTTYTFQQSITETAGVVNLVNDETSPGVSQYYGTDSGGVKGFFDLPVAGANRVEALQETCDAGHTTTTSVIIGSSTTAHSGVAGQLVQGSTSTASLAATNGVALNAGTTTGVTATAINSGSASGTTSFAANGATASNTNASAFGTGIASGTISIAGGTSTASGNRAVAFGLSNTASGTDSFVLGQSNTASGNSAIAAGNTIANQATSNGAVAIGVGNVASTSSWPFALGNQNTITGQSAFGIGRQNTCSGESSVCIGINNVNTGNSSNGRGAVAIGLSNVTTAIDAAIAIGDFSASSGKGAVGIGSGAKCLAWGEIAFGGGIPTYTGATALSTADVSAGVCQTSIVHYIQWAATSGAGSSLNVNGCRDAAGNPQSCGTFGNNYYELASNTIHYITGRLIGIDSTFGTCVWTIDTYVKNIGGTVTFGTTAFTNVVNDAAFVNMTAVTLGSTTTTGTKKSLDISYTFSSGRPVPVKFNCMLRITKLTY